MSKSRVKAFIIRWVQPLVKRVTDSIEKYKLPLTLFLIGILAMTLTIAIWDAYQIYQLQNPTAWPFVTNGTVA